MPVPIFPSLVDDRGGLGGTADRLCVTEGLPHRPPTAPAPSEEPVRIATPSRPTWSTTTCQSCGAALTINKVMCPGCGATQR